MSLSTESKTKLYQLLDKECATELKLAYENLAAKKITHIESLRDLIIARLSPDYEVRLKLTASSHYIQWMECTCLENRKQGRVCEHITTLLLHLLTKHPDRYSDVTFTAPKKLTHLSSNLKQGTAPQRGLPIRQDQLFAPPFVNSIQKIEAADTQSQTFKVHYSVNEVKACLELPVELCARLIELLPKNSKGIGHSLQIFDAVLMQGLFVELAENETVVATKSFYFKTKPTAPLNAKKYIEKALCKNLLSGEEEYIYRLNASCHVLFGGESSYLIGIGFFRFHEETAKEWRTISSSFTYKNDAAAKLLESQFFEFRSFAASVWLTKEVAHLKVADNLEIGDIDAVDNLEDSDKKIIQLAPKFKNDELSIAMHELVDLYYKKNREYVFTGSGWSTIPSLIKEHKWQKSKTSKAIQFDTLDLLRFEAMTGKLDKIAGSKKSLLKINKKLNVTAAEDPPLIANDKTELRNYQKEGYKWLWWLAQNGLHGLLADDMGLGKTHQTMTLMLALAQHKSLSQKNFLIICPATVIDHWYDKMAFYAPSLHAFKHYGTSRANLLQANIKNRTLITSYGILLRDISLFSEINWDLVVLDEAHFVKNNKTATYQAACRLKAQMRLCLTGTPLENNLRELKNIFDFLLPGYLGSTRFFNSHFLKPILNEKNREQELLLQKLIHPFKLRRKKADVLDDLPEKIEEKRFASLSDEQKNLYQSLLETHAKPLLEELRDKSKPVAFLHVFTLIQKMKQVCNHPALVLPVSYKKTTSEKFELFKTIISEAIESDNKVVVYSQYLKMLDIIESYLSEAGIGSVKLTGASTNRGKIIEEFQKNPEKKVFLGSLLAGGIGIDLTAASVVIHYDRWWNASKENQASDRVHRIGQKKFVQVFKLLTRGTIEEKIDGLITQKADLFSRFLEQDEDVFKTLQREQIIDLLS